MDRLFNTAGPCRSDQHYSIEPLSRIDWPEIQHLIDHERYFVLHAPRQTGKTTTLLAMMDALNQSGRYSALYMGIESAQSARNDVAGGMKTIMHSLVEGVALRLQDTRLRQWRSALWEQNGPHGAFKAILSCWAQENDKPIVLMLDEVDALIGDTLISLLRQLREGYISRSGVPFPQSVILCGVRDVRDYRIHTSHNEIITGGSAFNIKTESLCMGNFDAAASRALFLQHTEETGQTFANEIFPALWADTQGQPWLVNALAYELTWKNRGLRDRSRPITLEHYRAARECLIQSRATHLDQLADKLKEKRVRAVIAPILEGAGNERAFNPDDVSYVLDLGLINQKLNGAIYIANGIYQEVIPRELSWGSQIALAQEQASYLTAERHLDMPKLLAAFQQFFREHADVWLVDIDYHEAGPQLLLQAFLQRIVNGGGRINREYALGRKRTDLFIEWPLNEQQGFWGEVQRIVIELKIMRNSLERTISDGIHQTAGYARQVGASEAYLVIFNRNPDVSWNDKIWHRTEGVDDMSIVVWGA